MPKQTFSQRRCRDGRKPLWNTSPDVVFYQCETCGALYPVTTFGEEAGKAIEVSCCGHKLEQLVPQKYDEEKGLPNGIQLSYQIVGGFNDNAIKVAWKEPTYTWKPKWIYMKTFVGGYLKYIKENKKSPMVFALADTDAFCYCDRDPCVECTFRCKRGFIIYYYGDDIGLVEIPIDKMNPYWQLDAKKQAEQK